jgi:hypothetical protein
LWAEIAWFIIGKQWALLNKVKGLKRFCKRLATSSITEKLSVSGSQL